MNQFLGKLAGLFFESSSRTPAEGDMFTWDNTNKRFSIRAVLTAIAHAMTSTAHTAGTLGDIVYGGAAGAWTLLSGNTTSTKKFLTQTGTGSASAAPTWSTIADGDVPATHSGSAHHTRLHAITGTSDHSAGNWAQIYTDGSGHVQEVALDARNTALVSFGATAAPGMSYVPVVFGYARLTGQTAAQASVMTGTVDSYDATYMISANVLVTTSTTHNFTVTFTYVDESNTSRTVTLTFSQTSGTFVTSITNGTGAGPYMGIPLHVVCKGGTAFTLATTGTFTTVTYNVEAQLTRIFG